MKVFWIADFGLRIGWCVASMLQLLAVFPILEMIPSTMRSLKTMRVVSKTPDQQASLDLLVIYAAISTAVCGVLTILAIIGLAELKRAINRRLKEMHRCPPIPQSKIQNPQSKIG